MRTWSFARGISIENVYSVFLAWTHGVFATKVVICLATAFE